MTKNYIVLSVEGRSIAGKSLFLETIDPVIIPVHKDNEPVSITLAADENEVTCSLHFAANAIRNWLKNTISGDISRLGSILLVNPFDIQLDEQLMLSLRFLKQHELPYVVAINERKDSKKVTVAEVRASLRLDDNVLVLYCNAKDEVSCLRAAQKCLEQFPASENNLIIIEHMKNYINDIQKHASKNQS